MSSPRATVALLTDRRYVDPERGSSYVQNILEEDRLVQQGLEERGVDSRRVDWADPNIDWTVFDAAVFRTTWDYFERFDEFVAWIERVEGDVRLVNPATLVRWNWDKHYLVDLDTAGVQIVDTVFIERGQPIDLGALLLDRGWAQAVIKPAVSGGGRHTYRVDTDSATQLQSTMHRLLEGEAMLVQPFMDDIVERGEVTIMVVGGQVTHAVLKRAKPGDFRVQDDYGGTVHQHDPATDEVAFAEAAFAACPVPPTYGRVDLVRDAAGRLRVMELELIEPEMWFRFHPPAADALAAALAERLG